MFGDVVLFVIVVRGMILCFIILLLVIVFLFMFKFIIIGFMLFEFC